MRIGFVIVLIGSTMTQADDSMENSASALRRDQPRILDRGSVERIGRRERGEIR